MGRIKILLVKRSAKKLIGSGDFSKDFNRNKLVLSDTMPSKRIRNKVAGYISRLKRQVD